jgi:hypothetical protein
LSTIGVCALGWNCVRVVALSSFWYLRSRLRHARGCRCGRGSGAGAPGRGDGVLALRLVRLLADDVRIRRRAQVRDRGTVRVPVRARLEWKNRGDNRGKRDTLAGDSCRNDIHGDGYLDVLFAVKIAVVADRHLVVGLHVLFQNFHHPIARFSRLRYEVDASAFAHTLQKTFLRVGAVDLLP